MTSTAPQRKAIVVVEDDPDVLRVLQRLLSMLYRDYQVISASNGAEALAYVADHEVPLVITDYTMPEMSGLDLAAAVKAQTPATKVVLITAYATPEVERTARQAGIDYFLPKPFSLDQVEAIVREMLDEP